MVSEVSQPRCIYCLTTEGDFGAKEHIIPESLGNKVYILPNGYVCEKPCNHEKLSWLDNQLCGNIFMGFQRARFGIPNKEGKYPSLNAQNLTASWLPGRGFFITEKPNQKIIFDRKILEDGREAFKIKVRGQFKPQIIARALYKIGLGMVAFDYGHDAACDSRYKAARDFIIKGQGFPNHLLLRTISQDEIMPEGEMFLHVQPTATPFSITLFGLTAIMNLEPLPVVQLPDALARTGFESYPLYRLRKRSS
jgi:hypothetical protein